MIPAEARAIIDQLSNIKRSKDEILDAVECLSRIVSPSARDRQRVALATKITEDMSA